VRLRLRGRSLSGLAAFHLRVGGRQTLFLTLKGALLAGFFLSVQCNILYCGVAAGATPQPGLRGSAELRAHPRCLYLSLL